MSALSPPALVTVNVWGVRHRNIPRAMLRIASGPRRVKHYPGLTFAKFLGTASSASFLPQDTDLGHWAVLTCWDAPHAAATFERSSVISGWNSIAHERLSLSLVPLASRGTWSKQEPFGEPDGANPKGPVAAITRARLRPSKLATFMRAVPPVALQLSNSPGLVVAMGVGESPIGLQGTLSIWESAQALREFAYEGAAHRSAIEQTEQVGWYSEDLFARFQVKSAHGSFGGTRIDCGPTT